MFLPSLYHALLFHGMSVGWLDLVFEHWFGLYETSEPIHVAPKNIYFRTELISLGSAHVDSSLE